MIPLIDAHCHVTTTVAGTLDSSNFSDPNLMRCVMSTNVYDWDKLKSLGSDDGTFLSFGVHPWYSHLFSLGNPVSKHEHYTAVLESSSQANINDLIGLLPDPVDLNSYIDREFHIRRISCIGEIGIDKLFRLPENGFYQADQSARLSSVRVKLTHQVEVFTVFCRLAIKYSLPVSLHAVKCHGMMFDLCKSLLFPHEAVKICLHSYTGSFDTLENFWLKELPSSRIYLSLSRWISFKNADNGRKLLQALPLECTLTETDYAVDNEKENLLLEQVSYVIDEVTQTHQLESSQVAKQIIYDNFCRFISMNL